MHYHAPGAGPAAAPPPGAFGAGAPGGGGARPYGYPAAPSPPPLTHPYSQPAAAPEASANAGAGEAYPHFPAAQTERNPRPHGDEGDTRGGGVAGSGAGGGGYFATGGRHPPGSGCSGGGGAGYPAGGAGGGGYAAGGAAGGGGGHSAGGAPGGGYPSGAGGGRAAGNYSTGNYTSERPSENYPSGSAAVHGGAQAAGGEGYGLPHVGPSLGGGPGPRGAAPPPGPGGGYYGAGGGGAGQNPQQYGAAAGGYPGYGTGGAAAPPAAGAAGAPPGAGFAAAAPGAGFAGAGLAAAANYYGSGYDVSGGAPVSPGSNDSLSGLSGANSEFLQLSTQRVGETSVLGKRVPAVPVGLFVRPVAPSAAALPVISPPASFPRVIRCAQCRAYINCFVSFEAGGRRWLCNICNYSNETPAAYHCALDASGQRLDRLEKPEFSSPSYEVIANSDYLLRPPQPPAYVFAVDVSYGAVASGLLATVASTLHKVIEAEALSGDDRTRFGLVTFDTNVHFYKFGPAGARAQMLVLPQQETAGEAAADLFVPIPETAVVNLLDHRDSVLRLLAELPEIWAEQRATQTRLGPAVRAAEAALRSLGGCLHLFVSAPPVVEELARLTGRKVPKATRDREADLLRNRLPLLTDYGSKLGDFNISLSVWACPPGPPQDGGAAGGAAAAAPGAGFMNLPALSGLAEKSGGEVRFYPGFNALVHGDQFARELTHAVTREIYWESVVRIRVSPGWRVGRFFGNFTIRHNDLMNPGVSHSDWTCCCELALDEDAPAPAGRGGGRHAQFLFVQTAILGTVSVGERRIRVHNLCVPVAQHAPDAIRAVDEPVMAAFLVRRALDLVRSTPLAEARGSMQRTLQELSAAAARASGTLAYGQQPREPPPALQVLAQYLSAAAKTVAFRDGSDIGPDARVAHWSRLAACPPEQILAYIYPTLLPLHELAPGEGVAGGPENKVALPPQLPLTSAALVAHGAYLWTDGLTLLLWVSRAVDTRWLRAVFGVDSLEFVNTEYGDALLGTTGDALGERVASIVREVRFSSTAFPRLIIARQGSPAEQILFNGLVEAGVPGYGGGAALAGAGGYPQQPAQPAGAAAGGNAASGVAAGGYAGRPAGPYGAGFPPQPPGYGAKAPYAS